MPKRVPESEKKLNRSFTISPDLLKRVEEYQRDPTKFMVREDGSKREATFTEVMEIGLRKLVGGKHSEGWPRSPEEWNMGAGVPNIPKKF
jgi:hypothetical protein